MNLAIIPARGGSKRIPRKNIKKFHGKPIISYSIEAALQSDCFDNVIVSTDDLEIANLAKNLGAEIPFTRPENISDDYANTIDVIKHAINWYSNKQIKIDNVCCIYATAPFVTSASIKKGYKALTNGGFDFAFSATSYAFPIQRSFKRNNDGSVEMFYPEHLLSRSQDLEEAFHDAGQFYWGKSDAFLNDIPIFSEKSFAVLIPREQVQDIDTLEDWSVAERLFALNLN